MNTPDTDAGLLAAPLVATPAQARQDTEVEALVLAGDLCELARLLVGRLKETVLQMESVDGLATIAEGLTQIERTVAHAKAALDVGAAATRV